jgi:hypothetical protein
MRISVPVEIPVYRRRTTREKYALHHIAKGSYWKHLPLSLSVSDLRQHAAQGNQSQEYETTPLMLLVTGSRVKAVTLSTWKKPQKSHLLKPFDLLRSHAAQPPPGADDLDEDFVLLRFFGTLVTYTATSKQYKIQHTASLEAFATVLPKQITEKEVSKLEPYFRRGLLKARATSTWMLVDPNQKHPLEHFNESTGTNKKINE